MWNEITIQRINDSPEERVRDRPARNDGILWTEGPRQGKVHQKAKPANMLRVFQKVIVQLGLLVIPGIHLSGLFFNKKGIANLGKSVRSQHMEKAGG